MSEFYALLSFLVALLLGVSLRRTFVAMKRAMKVTALTEYLQRNSSRWLTLGTIVEESKLERGLVENTVLFGLQKNIMICRIADQLTEDLTHQQQQDLKFAELTSATIRFCEFRYLGGMNIKLKPRTPKRPGSAA